MPIFQHLTLAEPLLQIRRRITSFPVRRQFQHRPRSVSSRLANWTPFRRPAAEDYLLRRLSLFIFAFCFFVFFFEEMQFLLLQISINSGQRLRTSAGSLCASRLLRDKGRPCAAFARRMSVRGRKHVDGYPSETSHVLKKTQQSIINAAPDNPPIPCSGAS